ncbi:MAG: uroporphyrinogen decarboxylase [Gammaproteobacteria bacterium]
MRENLHVEMKNDRLIQALLRQPVDLTPVWIMRQAGRYLPEYRAIRERAGSFLRLCKTPELACEVTLQPLRRFPLDAAILFSDILTIPDAMGLGLSIVEGDGPRFDHTIRTLNDIERLADPDPESELCYVTDTIRLARRELNGDVPLIGFAGSPWTLATYMVEGGPGKDFPVIRGMLYRDPAILHRLLDKLSLVVTRCLNAQIAAGAQAVMLFDTWGGLLPRPAYLEFSLAYMARIVSGLVRQSEGRRVPAIIFSKGAGHCLEEIARSGCDAVGLDWTTDLGTARRAVGDRVALQGNLDPFVLSGGTEVIRAEAARILDAFGHGSGHVFNLGHGVHPDTDPARVAFMVNAVHDLSRKYHASGSNLPGPAA